MVNIRTLQSAPKVFALDLVYRFTTTSFPETRPWSSLVFLGPPWFSCPGLLSWSPGLMSSNPNVKRGD
ncbi:hypothetical protein BPOR_0250g00060 [Botrytis porri]|uniref:Uncharacterized protein n=1 Tax=Botrytis porri TaxID=87229 RepID=A0A4Z1KQS7_9HELO|nr:hypothetical protein BPOR_0250g00060 [Botrytis porri]